MSDLPPTAATDEPAKPDTPEETRPLARISDRLTEALVEPACSVGRDALGRTQRPDAWTPERIRIFLDALAECGVVGDAARTAGMSRQSAYNLRNRTANRAFHVAWNAAEQLARRRVSGDVLSRAIHGCVEVIVRDGEVWGERHRFDNRHTMAVLARLDRQAEATDDESITARLVAQEFDQFLDIVCAGGEGAADFIQSRKDADWSPGKSREAGVLERVDNYRRHGLGLPSTDQPAAPPPLDAPAPPGSVASG